MKSPTVITFATAITLLLPTSILALESTPSGSPATVTENIKNRLKETINEVSALESSNNIMGYVGKVRDIVKNIIIVEDKSGKKNIVINDDTTIVRSPGNTSIKLESVKIGDAVIAIGKAESADQETLGRRIIVSETPFAPPSKISGLAQIQKTTANSLNILQKGQSQALTLTLSDKTIIKSPTNSLELSDLNVGDTIIFSSLVDAKDSTKLTGTVIMRIKTATSVESSPAAKKPAPSPAPEY